MQFWRQLHLQPWISSEAPALRHSLGLLSIGLDYGDDCPRLGANTRRKSPHRLATGTPVVNVSPPEGTSTLTMESIDISLHINDMHETIVSSPQQTLREHVAQSVLDPATLFDVPMSFATQTMSTEGDEMLFSTSTIAQMSVSEHHAADICTDSIIPLLDAAMRTVISTRSGRLTPGLKLTADFSSTSLAELAPSLFNPNFLVV